MYIVLSNSFNLIIIHDIVTTKAFVDYFRISHHWREADVLIRRLSISVLFVDVDKRAVNYVPYMTWPPVDCIIDDYIRRAQTLFGQIHTSSRIVPAVCLCKNRLYGADRGFLRRA